MSSQQQTTSPPAQPQPSAPTQKKMCCCCPETKKARDECIIFKGEEGCAELIEAHKACLRKEGFDIK
eukprot:CAMPEP_0177631444 /NCGR_PEP_ID=MMETSP0447-20121125/1753_1 /TAXON_ID=0 /ORGANISM="Stygamoeba regulata, Strain BSH-02190019" /LENGTH=66 /DNA_ID=CAMNT_0019132929 /DNA_START=23 /DNA_END=223 /DNA_ORIENTATION=-